MKEHAVTFVLYFFSVCIYYISQNGLHIVYIINIISWYYIAYINKMQYIFSMLSSLFDWLTGSYYFAI